MWVSRLAQWFSYKQCGFIVIEDRSISSIRVSQFLPSLIIAYLLCSVTMSGTPIKRRTRLPEQSRGTLLYSFSCSTASASATPTPTQPTEPKQNFSLRSRQEAAAAVKSESRSAKSYASLGSIIAPAGLCSFVISTFFFGFNSRIYFSRSRR